MANARLSQQIRFLVEADKLKEILRQTLLTTSRRQETDAEHSWHLCLMTLVLVEHASTPGIDVLRVLKMLLIHDLVEIDAGDTFAYDTAAGAAQPDREARAADRIFGLLPADQTTELRTLWNEFEERATPEARFAAALDRFQPMLHNCLTEGEAWRRNGVTHDLVTARAAVIAEGSAELHAYITEKLAEALAAGHLPAGPA